jgi:hypothetical protein
MRKTTILGVVVLAVVVIGFSVPAALGSFGRSSSAAKAQSAVARARIIAAAGNPIRVRGFGFKARERVRVWIAGNTGTTKRVTASARGRFAVNLTTGTNCPNVTVKAAGNRGSRASYRVSSPVCP